MPLSIEREAERISAQEVKYWKRIIKSNLKIGVEIETNLDRRVPNSNAQRELQRALEPTGQVHKFGKYGVYDVKGDGSLSNGIELCTIGRRIDFLDLFYQYKFIVGHIMRHSPIMNGRCGLHNHVLLDYSSDYNSLEKPMPGIIMKNFSQLLKKHLPEIIWMTSTVKAIPDGDYDNIITRRESFCLAGKLNSTTVIGKTLSEFKEIVKNGTRYSALNMIPLDVNGDKINRLHFELRFPDGSIYPAQIASQNVLYSAMLMKAVELSEFGIITTGSDWSETKELYRKIRNDGDGNSEVRASYALPTELYPRFIQRAESFVDMIKPQLEIYDNQTYYILKMLAGKPVSLMRRDMDDTQVNDTLNATVETISVSHDSSFEGLKRMIVLQELTGAPSQREWASRITGKLGNTAQEIEAGLLKLAKTNKIEFDMVLGAPVIK